MKKDQAKQIEAAQASAGCLARIFTLVGLFWLGSIVVASINAYQSGGDFAITGSFIPALLFLFAARVIRRRATQVGETIPSDGSKASEPEEKVASPLPKTDTPKTRTQDEKVPPVRKTTPPPPQPVLPPRVVSQDPPRQSRAKPATQPSPQSDDGAGKPLSSEEMIKKAKARYLRDEDPDS